MKEKGNVDTEIQRTPPKAEDVRDAIGMEMKNRLEKLADIAEQAKRLGIPVDPMKALLEGVTPEALTSQVLKQAAELDAAAEVFSAHGVAPSVPEGQSDSAGRLASAVNNLCGGL